MTDVQLSIPERSALLALMTFVSPASNPEIRARYGFVITKPVRERLVDEGFLEATQGSRNAYTYELLDKGWARCRDELTAPLPNRANRGYRIMYGVLGCLERYLTATGLTLADLLDPQDRTDTGDADRAAGDRLRAAYDRLAAQPGAWVGLANLRAALTDVSRQEFDGALLELALRPGVSLIPEANQKALTADDRAAAINAGGEDKHLLQIRST